MSSESESGEFHEMRQPDVEKIVVHMAVGRGGEPLARAEEILAEITGQTPVRTVAEATVQDFDVRAGDPIGGKVTLRGGDAEAFLSQEYDSEIGIYGLDVTVNLVRPGYRVAKRDKVSRSIPSRHRLSAEFFDRGG